MKRTLLYLIILLSLALPASAADPFFRDVIVTSPDGIWTDPRAYTTLNAAVTAVGANVRTIVIPSAQVVTALTIPANVTLRFERDGSITNSGQLTINTPRIEAAARQIFTGAGDIDFVAGTVVKSSWFVDLDEALDVTSDDTVTIVITESETTTADMAVGNDVTLRWESPFIITVDTTHTLSNVKNIEAGNYQIFAGAGDIDFLDGTVLELSWFTRLRNVITWVEAEEVTLVISEESIVDFTDTIDPNIELKFNAGGSFSVNGGVVLSGLGNITAGKQQIFSGAGDVDFLTGSTLHTSWFGSLVNADTYTDDDNVSLSLIVDSSETIAANTTIDAYQSLEFPSGAILTVSGGFTLTITGNITAGIYQIFSGAGTVTIDGHTRVGYPQWWGAKGDNSTDDTDALQAAIDALPLKILFIPKGRYIVSDTITISSQGITIEGEGGNYFFQNADPVHGTVIKWDGGAGGTVVKVTPNTLIRPMVAPILRRLTIDGQSLAEIGLRIEATVQGVFEHLYLAHCTDKAIHTGGTDAVGYTGLNYTHSCMFRDIGIDQVFVTDGDGIVLDGSNATGATTTICGFYDLHIRHYDGIGINIARGDNNSFYNTAVGRPAGGSGVGIQFSASANAPSVNTNVMFYTVAGQGGVYSEAGVVNAVGNSIYGLSIDIANPAPVIDAGSTLFYHQLFDATDADQTFGQNRIKLNGSYYNPFAIIGTHTYGINLVDGTYSSSQLRLKNNSVVSARNNADDADDEIFRYSTTDELTFAVPLRIGNGDDINTSIVNGSKLGGTNLQKVGFWGTTPVVQPAANPDTAAAVLADLEIEVNQLKALLRLVGLMAP